MKRVIKRYNRKGFTLVETLLAVFILVVVSTMLIRGFLTTIGYSYQTAIYAKSAAMNYSICMSSSGDWSMRKNHTSNTVEGREQYAVNNYLATNKHVLNFIPGSDYTACESLYVAVLKNGSLSPAVPGTLPFQSDNYAPKNDHYVDNRTAVIYYPEYCTKTGTPSGSNAGDIVVMMDTTDTDNVKYYWVVAPSGAFNADGSIKKDYDLTSVPNEDIIAPVGPTPVPTTEDSSTDT